MFIYMDDTMIITRAGRCLSSVNLMAQGALGATGVRRVWAGAGLQHAAYRGGGISCGLAHSLFPVLSREFELK